MGIIRKDNKLRFLIIQVIPKRFDKNQLDTDLLETRQLIATFGGRVIKEMIQRRDHPSPKFYVDPGKVEEIGQLVETEEIDVVVINDIVKSSQIFRVEKELWKVSKDIMVWDRIDLILNIFEQHAHTIEAKLQIKLARATHMGPRIYGLGKTELSRQGGGVGTRGKGETNIEFERRQIKVDQQKIKKELKKLIKQKRNRLQKRNQMGIGPVALVGYTSAGKTTLFNTLTGKEKEMNQGLFTTLDTVVGKLKTPKFERPILVSDTIGFINNLPPVLIDSFKSTLLESLEAKLILHVVDAHDPQILEKIITVEDILNKLDAKQPKILVLNKTDLVTESELRLVQEKIENHYNELAQPIQLISAKSGKNINMLKGKISDYFDEL
jgi:GTPase